MRNLKRLTLTLVIATAGFGGAPALIQAQERKVPDTYKATTVNMSPAQVELKIDVMQWSTDDSRAAVVAALGADEPVAALRELPTLGVVWRNGSAVGHSIKYAHRTTLSDGSEQVTLVTDRAIGATSFVPWTADDPATDEALEYSVLEMTTNGDGTMSLAADVMIDAESSTVSLESGTGMPLLADVRKEPPPYWANAGN